MKNISPQRRFSLRAKILRLLRMIRGFGENPSSREEIVHFAVPTTSHHNYWKEIETGLLEAERRKSEALMESQRRHFIC